MDDVATVVTRHQLATKLLSVTPIQSLRSEVRRNRDWVAIFRGFRPDSLTRPLFVRGAATFAANPNRLASLCELFLDSTGVEKQPSLAERFAAASGLTELDADVRDFCRQLTSTALADLPIGGPASGPSAGQTTEASVDSEKLISDQFQVEAGEQGPEHQSGQSKTEEVEPKAPRGNSKKVP